MTKCPHCEGSIDNKVGVCLDCGFDAVQYAFEFEEWLDDTTPPVEVYADYQEAA